MRVLAVDTSTDYLATAICDGAQIIAEYSILAGRRHAERILEIIGRALADADLKLAELDLLAVTIGPGSFTGLRIGVSTLKGLAEGAGLRLAGVTTLDAMARQSQVRDGLVCPLLDARMDEVYGAVHRFTDGAQQIVKPAVVAPVEQVLAGLNEPVVVFGEGALNYRSRIVKSCPSAQFLRALDTHPRASAVAQEAIAAVSAGANTDAALVRPVYLRQSQPEEARRRAREAATA
jgi:tRNA threonylcarbamoyladenosine biosynthesis protein TsaB